MDIHWIKLYTNIFDNRKIKQIEKLPDGDTILVIWLKLLTLAGNINDSGMIYITTDIPYTNETLAAEFNKPISTVNLALQTFVKFQMIDIVDNFLQISNWERYQNIESMESVREQNRIRQKNWYNRQKNRAIIDENNPNVSLTLANALANGIEENREDKNRIDKNRKDINNIGQVPDKNNKKSMEETIPYQEIIDYLNLKANKHYRKTNKTTTSIRARYRDGFTKDDFFYVIDVKCSEWLNDEKMDMYLRPETLFGTKFESYLNSKPKAKKKSNNMFMNALKEDN